MAITVSWDDERQSTVLVVFAGALTAEDAANGAQALSNLIENKFRRLDMIFYVHPSVRFSPLNTADLRQIVSHIPTNPGTHVLVNAPAPMRKAAAIFAGLIAPWMGIQLLHAETVKEARQLIAISARAKGDNVSDT